MNRVFFTLAVFAFISISTAAGEEKFSLEEGEQQHHFFQNAQRSAHIFIRNSPQTLVAVSFPEGNRTLALWFSENVQAEFLSLDRLQLHKEGSLRGVNFPLRLGKSHFQITRTLFGEVQAVRSFIEKGKCLQDRAIGNFLQLAETFTPQEKSTLEEHGISWEALAHWKQASVTHYQKHDQFHIDWKRPNLQGNKRYLLRFSFPLSQEVHIYPDCTIQGKEAGIVFDITAATDFSAYQPLSASQILTQKGKEFLKQEGNLSLKKNLLKALTFLSFQENPIAASCGFLQPFGNEPNFALEPLSSFLQESTYQKMNEALSWPLRSSEGGTPSIMFEELLAFQETYGQKGFQEALKELGSWK